MDKKALKRLIDVAAGREPADLVLKNANVIDVYQAEMISGDLAIIDGKIAGINGEYHGKETIDLKGKIVAPGFIDPHIHVESSYVTPEEDEVLDKLLAAKERGLRIDGHSPMVFNEELNAYAAAGIANDHECSTVEELKDRIARGMYVFLREGSVTQNLRTLLNGVTDNNYQRCVLSADDLQAKTILEKGHLDNSIRICIEEGVSPLRAIQMATINAAQCCQLTDRGAIAPGLRADLVIFSDLAQPEIEATYIEGKLVAEKGTYLPTVKRISTEKVQSSVHIDKFRKEQLKLNLTSDKARAIEVIPQEALTNEAIVSVKRDDQGQFVFDPKQDVTKIAVIERHHNTGNAFVGLLKGYGVKKGAIGLSIAHDSHNLIVTGTNDEDMAAAVKTLKEQEGGVVLIESGKIIGNMALPVAGLMSDLTGEKVAQQEAKINRLAHEVLGVSNNVDPIMTLGFMSLAVIPNLKITDIGLVDVTKFEIVPVSVEA